MNRNKRFKVVNIIGCLALCWIGMLYSGFQTISDSIAANYSQPLSIIGVYIALFFLGNISSLLIAGEISDRRGKKLTTLIGCLLMAVSTLLIAVAPLKVILYLGIFLYGGSHGIIEGTLSSALVDENPQFETGISSLTQAFFSVGAIAAPILSVAYIAGGGNYRYIFLLFSLLFFIMMFTLRALKFGSIPVYQRERKKPILFFALQDGEFIMMAIMMMIYVGVETGYCFYVKQYFIDTVNSEHLGALSLSAFWAAMVISRLLAGFLNNRDNIIFKIIPVGMFLSMTLLLLIPNVYVKVLLSGFFGFFCGPMWPLVFTLGTKKQPQNSGTASSFMVLSGSVGGMIFPPILGFIGRSSNVIMWLFLILPFTLIILEYFQSSDINKINYKA